MENRSFANGTAVEIYNDFALNIIQKANEKQFYIFLPSFSVLCVLLIVGIPGNCLALFVYSKKLKRGIARGLLITLITGDILSCLVVVPFELHIMNHFFDNYYELPCKLLRLFSYSVNNITSIVLLGIAFERYRVICTPWKSMLSPSTIRRTCYLIVIVSILYAIPMYFLYGIQTIPLYSEKRRGSNFTMESYNFNLTLSYKTIRASSDGFTVFGKSCLTDDNHRENAERQLVNKMISGRENRQSALDSAINPIIYCYCNKDFRQALISCLKLNKCRKEHSVVETGNAEGNDNDTDV
ncbi:GPR39-like protein [Mya arenaria]|uniref:GPR39-like protein n=1 Tax=Mya arenaria TaxID=6604 RepID=A0ABY7GA12_MYAAR|nr:GPR39-like protein [Mya arenaria]